MKPAQSSLLFAALVASTAALAQTAPPEGPPADAPPPAPTRSVKSAPWEAPYHLIAINPLSLLSGQLSLEYEQGLGHTASLLFSPSAVLFPGVFTSFEPNTRVLGFGLMIGLHFFPYPNGLNGFWIGPEVTAQYVSVNAPTWEGAGFGVVVAGALGYTSIIADHFSISGGLGFGWQKIWAAVADGTTVGTGVGSGFALTGRLSFGYAF